MTGELISVPQFNSTAYIAYPTIHDAILSVHLRITFKLLSTDDGLLLYNAFDPLGSGDFIALSIKDERVVFQFDTGSGPFQHSGLIQFII